MKANQLLSALESYQTFDDLKKDMEALFVQHTFDPVKDKYEIDQINSNIACFASSMEIWQDDFNKTCEFTVDLAAVDQRQLYSVLKELHDEEEELTGMSEAWESGDACDMACNDPGLQYEQGQKVETLWAEFEQTYKKY